MMSPVFLIFLKEIVPNLLFMDKNIKLLLQEIRDKDTREIVEDHIRNISLDEEKKETIILIDKQYVINILQSSQYIEHFIGAIKKCFGEHMHITIRLHHPHQTHDREMLIPYAIHY